MGTKVTTCCHEDLALTLIHNGMWPASPVKPRVAFSMELLELCSCMQLYGCMSIQAFASSILQMDCLMGIQLVQSEGTTLYRNLLGAIKEYRFHKNAILQGGVLATSNLHSCGICMMVTIFCLFLKCVICNIIIYMSDAFKKNCICKSFVLE